MLVAMFGGECSCRCKLEDEKMTAVEWVWPHGLQGRVGCSSDQEAPAGPGTGYRAGRYRAAPHQLSCSGGEPNELGTLQGTNSWSSGVVVA